MIGTWPLFLAKQGYLNEKARLLVLGDDSLFTKAQADFQLVFKQRSVTERQLSEALEKVYRTTYATQVVPSASYSAGSPESMTKAFESEEAIRKTFARGGWVASKLGRTSGGPLSYEACTKELIKAFYKAERAAQLTVSGLPDKTVKEIKIDDIASLKVLKTDRAHPLVNHY